jgi:hypothetical protein
LPALLFSSLLALSSTSPSLPVGVIVVPYKRIFTSTQKCSSTYSRLALNNTPLQRGYMLTTAGTGGIHIRTSLYVYKTRLH